MFSPLDALVGASKEMLGVALEIGKLAVGVPFEVNVRVSQKIIDMCSEQNMQTPELNSMSSPDAKSNPALPPSRDQLDTVLDRLLEHVATTPIPEASQN